MRRGKGRFRVLSDGQVALTSSSPASLGFTDYSQVSMMGMRYNPSALGQERFRAHQIGEQKQTETELDVREVGLRVALHPSTPVPSISTELFSCLRVSPTHHFAAQLSGSTHRGHSQSVLAPEKHHIGGGEAADLGFEDESLRQFSAVEACFICEVPHHHPPFRGSGEKLGGALIARPGQFGRNAGTGMGVG